MDAVRSESTEPIVQPSTNPVTKLLDAQVDARLDARLEEMLDAKLASLAHGGGGGGGHIPTMSGTDKQIRDIEKEVHILKGSVDWAKIVFATLIAVVLGGFALLTNVTLNVSAKVDGISSKIADEFRAQRLEQAAQISAISASISATKQQAPQVILVPAPSSASSEQTKKN